MQKKHWLKAGGKAIHAMPFLLPSLVGLFVFSLIPIVISFFLSMTDWNGIDPLSSTTFFKDHFVGLKNYVSICKSDEFYQVLGNTIYFIVLYIPFLFIASLGIAWLLNQPRKGKHVFRIIYYIPVLTSWIAASLIWKWVLAPKFGLMNQVFAWFGVEGPAWLQSRHWAMPSIAIASVWKDMGFFGLILLSGLQSIDSSYYEAAAIDGADQFQQFFKITLPLLTPSLFFVLIISLINAFQLFPQVMIMTGGGPNGATQVMVERIYTYGFRYYEMGYAAAFSWILFLILFGLTRLQLRFQKEWVYYGA